MEKDSRWNGGGIEKPNNPTRKLKESLTNRMNQAGYRLLSPENKVEDLDVTSKENHFLNTEKKHIENVKYHKNSKLWIIGIDSRKEPKVSGIIQNFKKILRKTSPN